MSPEYHTIDGATFTATASTALKTTTPDTEPPWNFT